MSEEIRRKVSEHYAEIALREGSFCPSEDWCGDRDPSRTALRLGYGSGDLAAVPEGANLGLGCGNPLLHAGLEAGMTVLDLGSGAGFDAFLAARRVGPKGRVFGVDMTPAMVEKARENARKGGYANVEFLLGAIEGLPLPSSSVDVVISNCVINLSPDKPAVFREAFRVLKAGGRLCVSDIVLLEPLPAEIRGSVEAYAGCIAGADLLETYLGRIGEAGFRQVEVLESAPFPLELMARDLEGTDVGRWAAEHPAEAARAASAVRSAKVRARKPA